MIDIRKYFDTFLLRKHDFYFCANYFNLCYSFISETFTFQNEFLPTISNNKFLSQISFEWTEKTTL